MQINCNFHGPYETDTLPSACPACLTVTGQTTINCDNHGIQVVKPGNRCGFCVRENIVDEPLHRVQGRQNSPIATYYRPSKRKLKK